jgi:hypothetical protein
MNAPSTAYDSVISGRQSPEEWAPLLAAQKSPRSARAIPAEERSSGFCSISR